jgi:CRP-like cAMP-binding protein
MIDQTEILEKYYKINELRKGEYFVKEGQYSKEIGSKESGMLHSYQIDSKGESITTIFF